MIADTYRRHGNMAPIFFFRAQNMSYSEATEQRRTL
nr:MAG TPA: hypothetical protein [Caudoviricetes sp.]